MDIRKALDFIKLTIENSFTAAVRSLKQATFAVKLDSNKVEVTNPTVLPDEYKVRILDEKDYTAQLKVMRDYLVKSLDEINTSIQENGPQKEVSISNLKDIQIPPAPNEITIKNPVKDVSVSNINKVVEALQSLKEVVSKLPTKYPEAKDEVSIKNLRELSNIFDGVKTAIEGIKAPVQKVIDFRSSNPKEYIPVRLSDGDNFYNAIENLRVAAGRSFSFSNESGARQQALVDGDRHVQVDIVEMPPITIPPVTGGATEAKQDDIIAAIGNIPGPLPDNHQVTVSNQISTAGLASEEGQAAIVEAIGDIPPTDTSLLATAAKQLPDNHQVSVSNHPTEFPLPAAQVNALTPPAAISGFATSAKQDSLLTEVQKKTEPTDFQMTDIMVLLKQLLTAVVYPNYLDRSLNSIRIGNNTVSIAANQDIRTVATVTNLGTFPADHMQRMNNMTAWAVNVRSRLS